MARMRRKGGVGGAGKGERKKTSPETAAREPAPSGAAKGMDRKSRLVVASLMGGLLGLFLLIGVLAPDPLHNEGRPAGVTVFWRLLFLLVPLAVMYGLLWGENFLGFVKRSKARKKS
jgi:hypothetical protein